MGRDVVLAANAEVFSCKGASSGKRVCSSQKRSVKCGLPKHVYAQPFFAIRVRSFTTDAVCRLRGSWRGKRRDVSGGRLLVIFGWRCPVWDAGCRCFLLVCNVSLECLSGLYVKKFCFLDCGALIWHFSFTFAVNSSCALLLRFRRKLHVRIPLVMSSRF